MNKLIVLSTGLFLVNNVIGMTSEKLLSLPSNGPKMCQDKIKLVISKNSMGEYESRECILCIGMEIRRQGLTQCKICTWESKRPAEAIEELFRHVIRSHTNLKSNRYWDKKNQKCILCNDPIGTSCGITGHLISQHIGNIAEHAERYYCDKTKQFWCSIEDNDKSKESIVTIAQSSPMDIDKKKYIRFDISKFEERIKEIHKQSAFCLVCVKESIENESKKIDTRDVPPAVVYQKRVDLYIKSMMNFVSKHALDSVVRVCAITEKCPMCNDIFSSEYIVYHHVFFKHILKQISHKFPGGNCLNREEEAKKNQMELVYQQNADIFFSDDFLKEFYVTD